MPKTPDQDKIIAKLEADLAERRQIERELAHMASFADWAPIPMIEVNPDFSIGYQNPAAEQTFPTLLKLGDAHPLFEGFKSAVEALKQGKKTLVTRPVKIEDRVYDQQISLVDGGPRMRLYMSDITELKRLDQLKTDFVNMVSHELRSPLTTIAATIKMVSAGVMGTVTADQTEALQLAQVNIDRLGRMINDLLDISKIEAGKLTLQRARVDMAALVKEVCRSFEPLAKERGLEIRPQFSPERIETLVDRDKILQVFTNLINNALKFTQAGHVEVSAVLTGEAVECRVADTGPGIPPAELPRIFGKFHQVGRAAKSREKGTGLGLSLCKGLVELHGGKIWVESRLEEGSRFIFVLPTFGDQELFHEKVHTAVTDAEADGTALSLVRVDFQGWTAFRDAASEHDARRAAQQLQAKVETMVRSDSDALLQLEGSLLLLLPSVDRKAALGIAERLRQSWPHPAVPEFNVPFGIGVRTASFPEDAGTASDLLARLE